MSSLLDAFMLIIPLIIGIISGYFLRGRKLFYIGKLITGSILILIFSLGFSIGSNSELLAIMPEIGLKALVLLIMALFFSILFVKAVRKLVRV